MPLPTRVVVVDDDSNDCGELIARLRREDGFEVARFDSGAEAMTYAEASAAPAVLFLGALRHFLGLQARIEAGSPSRKLRILLVTGAPSWSLPRLSDVMVLRKPMDVDEMFAAIVGTLAWSPAPLCAA